MKKIITVLGVVGLSLTAAACSSNDEFSGLDPLSVECRTAGFDCVEEERVVVKKEKTRKAKRVFERSLRK